MSYPSSQLRFIDIAQTPKGFSLLAPLSGEILPLNVLLQPLLNHGLSGEGVAIHLSANKLLAPFDGVVSELPASCHRIQLTANNGIKLLIALPPSTRQLMGQGFNRQVTEQQNISKGQTLFTFNLQQLQQLHEQQYPGQPCYAAVLITNSDKVGQLFASKRKVTAGEDVLLTVLGKKAAKQTVAPNKTLSKTATKAPSPPTKAP